ncbi:hypothetical protein [Egicoccus sp. AB-alg6-2]|uniref:hypothetical protein n=1 Tax=Egicoccus sp. AB-alg6-2 TaxID=3242692 RepID=UPI00359EC559
MAELLRVAVADDVRTLAAPSPVLDPATAVVVEQAAAAARAQGRAEGEAAGRRTATDAAMQLGGRLDALLQELLTQRAAARAADLELAARLAAAVLDATPPTSALHLLDRVRDAAAVLDDDPLEVRLHPDDEAAIASAPRDPRLHLVADPSVAPGDAVLTGAWGGAELTRAAMLDAAVALHAEGLTAGDTTGGTR